MFRIGKIYKHNNMRTVKFMVVKSFFVPEKKIYKLKIVWFTDPSGLCLGRDKVNVKFKDAKDYYTVEGDVAGNG